MGVLLLHSDYKLDGVLQEITANVVTLIVPEATLSLYSESERRQLAKRIPELLERYSKYLTAIPRLGHKAWKTLYQNSPGPKKMKRINVRLSTGSWVLFGTLAQAHGVSRCFLFNFLLELDRAGVGYSIVNTMNEGGPTFHRNYSYILHLDLLNNRITRTLQCIPENSFYVLDYRDWFDS
ncbi:DUF1564 domain-containing protein [Leptospira yasudae]|uniref:DUF1564 domain-containing protein n=1 Tax=Leptospira yasudae TaxID=2202201 RepID=UPI001091675E|nr:DUF1564 domain-containing protein [Leptospira yasudae]TGM99171.1 DUF1564 domain-containing protein [Leptospira yasudae]